MSSSNCLVKTRRTLKYGMNGEDIKNVQKVLIHYGYMDSTAHGYYGIITEEAVKRMQRDYRLHSDGIIGKKTLRLLKQGRIFENREIHEVKQGEDINDIAKKYDVGKAAIISATGRDEVKGLYPGKAVSIYRRKMVGVISRWSSLEEFDMLEDNSSLDVQTILSPLVTLNKGGIPKISPGELINNTNCENKNMFIRIGTLNGETNSYDNMIKVMRNSEIQSRFICEIDKLINETGAFGICFQVTFMHNEAVKDLAKFIECFRSQLETEIAIGIIIPGELPLEAGFPFGAMCKLCNFVDWISLGVPKEIVPFDERTITSNYSDIYRSLEKLTIDIPRNKIFLSLFTYGLQRITGKRNYTKMVEFEQAEKIAYRYGTRGKWDKDIKAYNFSYRSRRSEYDVWYEGKEGLNSRCRLINKFNLGGFVICHMTFADRMFWEVVKANFIPENKGVEE